MEGDQRDFKVLCNAFGFRINPQKSTFLQYGVNQSVLDSLKSFFPFNTRDLSEGFRYLSFFLKVDRYKLDDWIWFAEK